MRKRQTDILRRLIARGWLVDETGRNGDTPVCLAAEDCCAAASECISMLCVAGVRIEYALFAFFELALSLVLRSRATATGEVAASRPCCVLSL